MRELIFANAEGVYQKLNGVIVRWKGEYCYCLANPESYNVKLSPITGEPSFMADACDPNLDYSAPSLGYANLNNQGAVFLSRPPVKQFQGGLPVNLISPWSLTYKEFLPRMRDLRIMAGFKDMLLQKYPAFKDALRYVANPNRDVSSRAFDRRFALRGWNNVILKNGLPSTVRVIELYHEDCLMGVWDKEKRAITLEPRYLHSFSRTKLHNAGVPLWQI